MNTGSNRSPQNTQISHAIEQLLEHDNLKRFRERVNRYSNHALADVAEILEVCHQTSIPERNTAASIPVLEPVLA